MLSKNNNKHPSVSSNSRDLEVAAILNNVPNVVMSKMLILPKSSLP